jgi:hypothetical protein
VGHPRERVDGGGAHPRPPVRAPETIVRIKRLSMPRYGKLGRDDLHNRIAQIHALCMAYELELGASRDDEDQDTSGVGGGGGGG